MYKVPMQNWTDSSLCVWPCTARVRVRVRGRVNVDVSVSVRVRVRGFRHTLLSANPSPNPPLRCEAQVNFDKGDL